MLYVGQSILLLRFNYECFGDSQEKRDVYWKKQHSSFLLSRKEMHLMRKRGVNLLLSSIVTVQKFILSLEDSGAVEQ